MRTLGLIAKLQILSCIRRQMHLMTLFVGVILIMMPSYVNLFGLGQVTYHVVCQDMGLVTIGLYGLLFGLYFGSTTIPAEIENRSIYPILARPLGTFEYVAGQYLGLSVLSAASFSLLGLCFFGASSLLSLNPEDPHFFLVLAALYLESQVILALCLYFSTRFKPVLAGLCSLGIYVVGGLSEGLLRVFLLGRESQGPGLWLARVIKGMLPNFEVFHIKAAVVHSIDLPASFVASMVAYGIGWIVLMLALSVSELEKRDL